VKFEIDFTGHENIRSLHTKTIEVTKESSLTSNGDCIVGVNASCACDDLPLKMKKKLQNPRSIVNFSIIVGNYSFNFTGKGNPSLTLTHTNDIVIRKSNFTCPRTLAVSSDKASDDVPRKMIDLLQNPKTKGKLLINVK